MKFLRNVDTLSYSLASSQARIFENSVSFGIPSKIFIKCYMLSNQAKLLDDLSLDVAGLSEVEIFDAVKENIKTTRGELYPFEIMHYIGFFYRMCSYLTGENSNWVYIKIKPDFLYKNYKMIHSLPIQEAIKEVFEIKNIELEDKYSLFKKLYKIEL